MTSNLFGTPLPHEGRMPDVFALGLSFLELNALQTTGILRISGSKVQINKMKEEFETSVRYDFHEGDDIYDVAGVFRLWLHMLPESIIPPEHYEDLLQIARSTSKRKILAGLKKLFASLPPLRMSILEKLCRLMRLISLYADVNKMTSQNLAVVMGPNLIRGHDNPNKQPLEALGEVHLVNKLIEFTIDHYDELLCAEPEADVVLTMTKKASRVFTHQKVDKKRNNDLNLLFVPNLNAPIEEDASETSSTGEDSDSKPSSPRKTNSTRRRAYSNALEWLLVTNEIDSDGFEDPEELERREKEEKEKEREAKDERRRLANEEFERKQKEKEKAQLVNSRGRKRAHTVAEN